MRMTNDSAKYFSRSGKYSAVATYVLASDHFITRCHVADSAVAMMADWIDTDRHISKWGKETHRLYRIYDMLTDTVLLEATS